jgi:chromosome segregation ATPase
MPITDNRLPQVIARDGYEPFAEVSSEALTSKCKGSVADKVRELQGEVRERQRRVTEITSSRDTAQEALADIESQIPGAMDRETESGDSSEVLSLHQHAQAAAAALRSDATLHKERLTRAHDALLSSHGELQTYVDQHAQELSQSLDPDAHRVSETYQKALTGFEQKVAPLIHEYGEILRTQAQLAGHSFPIKRTDLPSGERFEQPPIVAWPALPDSQGTTVKPELIHA